MDTNILYAQLDSNWSIEEIYSEEIGLFEKWGKTFFVCGEDGIRKRDYQNRYQELCNMGNFENNLMAACLRWGNLDEQRKKANTLNNQILLLKTEADARQLLDKEFTKEQWDLIDFDSNGTADGKLVIFTKTVATIRKEEGIKKTCLAYTLNGKRIHLEMFPIFGDRNKVLLYAKIAYAVLLIPIFLKFIEEYLPKADTDTKLQLICFGLTETVRVIHEIERPKVESQLENATERLEKEEESNSFIEKEAEENKMERFTEEIPMERSIEEKQIEKVIEKLNKQRIENEKKDVIKVLQWFDGPYQSLGSYRVIRTVIDERDSFRPDENKYWMKMDILEADRIFIVEYRKGLQETSLGSRYENICKHAQISKDMINCDREYLMKLMPEIQFDKVVIEKEKIGFVKERTEESFWKKFIKKLLRK